MKKLSLACFFLLSVFFSKSYGMDSCGTMMSNLRQMMMKRNVLIHILFGSISRYVIQSADSIWIEQFPENVHTEEDKIELDFLFHEYERLLQEGTLLSVITVNEFDESFIDEESLKLFICDEREKEINKIRFNEEIYYMDKVKMIDKFEKRFDSLVNIIKEKLGFLRQIIVEKQGLEVDISVLEEESERLDYFVKKIVKNRYSCLETPSSDKYGECVIS